MNADEDTPVSSGQQRSRGGLTLAKSTADDPYRLYIYSIPNHPIVNPTRYLDTRLWVKNKNFQQRFYGISRPTATVTTTDNTSTHPCPQLICIHNSPVSTTHVSLQLMFVHNSHLYTTHVIQATLQY